jgi:hypothetical protein
MALAVECARREQTSLVEIDIEIELAFAGSEPSGKFGLVVFVMIR